ncbi:hypothetical protein AWB71_06012 [Caballeronia peredens]|nr:hypothetical protein AWB71_06012 [Caballeronia peredens]
MIVEENMEASVENINLCSRETNRLFERFNEVMEDFNSTDADFLQNCQKNIVLGEHIAHVALAISLVNKEIMRMAQELLNREEASSKEQ